MTALHYDDDGQRQLIELVGGDNDDNDPCRAIPIGVMYMIDEGEKDYKIICVHADDPSYKDYKSISDLPPHILDELKMCVIVR